MSNCLSNSTGASLRLPGLNPYQAAPTSIPKFTKPTDIMRPRSSANSRTSQTSARNGPVHVDRDVAILMKFKSASRRGRMDLAECVGAYLGAILDFCFRHVTNSDSGCNEWEFRDLDEQRRAARDDACQIARATNEGARPRVLEAIEALRLEVEWKVVESDALVGQFFDS